MTDSSTLAQKIILTLADKAGVSGYEGSLQPHLNAIFPDLADQTYTDFMENYYAVKYGESGRATIMLAAHMDEIGLMVTHIDQHGFVHFAPVGGIDERTLLYQDVLIHGKQSVSGIICFDPEKADIAKGKAILCTDLAIDTGFDAATVKTMVSPGDIISLVRKPLELLNDQIAGKSLDDRAGVAVMAVCLHELRKLRHRHHVAAVCTVQEEVGLRGAATSCYRLEPALAVAIDVTHAQTLDTKSQVTVQIGKGPVISLGPNIHPGVYNSLVDNARENRINYQIQPIPGGTGTDARVLQLTGHGIATGLISIPLRYMHTTVEMLSVKDVVDCGKLLAAFISSLPDDLEEMLCF